MKKIVFAFLAVVFLCSLSSASVIWNKGTTSSSGNTVDADFYIFNIGEVYASSTTYPFFYNQFYTIAASMTITGVRAYSSYISTVSACNYDVVWSSTTSGARTWQSIFSTTTALGLVVDTTSYVGSTFVPDFKATLPANSSIAPLFYSAPATGIAPTTKIQVKYQN